MKAHAGRQAWAKPRRRNARPAETDFPVSPLLDWSLLVLLHLVFFYLLFLLVAAKPAAPEGDIPLLVAEEDAKAGQPECRGRVFATEAGQIARIRLRTGSDADPWVDCGPRPEEVLPALRKLAADQDRRNGVALPVRLFARRRLILELDGRLLQAYVVQLCGAARAAGFADVSLVPLAPGSVP